MEQDDFLATQRRLSGIHKQTAELKPARRGPWDLDTQIDNMLYIRADRFHLSTVLREMLSASICRREAANEPHEMKLTGVIDQDLLTLSLTDNGHKRHGYHLAPYLGRSLADCCCWAPPRAAWGAESRCAARASRCSCRNALGPPQLISARRRTGR